jgi:hypothetical protein
VGVLNAVVLEEYPEAFWDSKDCMAMGDVFDDFAVDMLPTSPRLRRTSSGLYCSLGSTGGTYRSAFARERDEE